MKAKTKNPKMISDINANIRHHIRVNGFTLADVAKHLGVTGAAMTAYLKSSMPTYRAKRIADYIGVSLPELISDGSERQPTTKDVTIVKCPCCGRYIRVGTDIKFCVTKAQSD